MLLSSYSIEKHTLWHYVQNNILWHLQNNIVWHLIDCFEMQKKYRVEPLPLE